MNFELLRKLITDNQIASLLPRLMYFTALTLLIGLYWILYNLIVKWLAKRTKTYKVFTWQRLILTAVAILLSVLTLIIAFIDNLAVFFGSISVLSAAIVFALQDFVSSFFAWVYIQLAEEYKVDDVIQYSTDNRVIYGPVTELGMFRTVIKERLGGISLDKEMTTGKLVTFPNHYIFKHSLTNLTKNHLLLTHKFEVTVTYETDYHLANNVLEKTLSDTFNRLLQKPDRYFDSQVQDLASYAPKIYHHIDSSGVTFTIWISCRGGTLRPVLECYSTAILDAFVENNIHLAYPTYRITH
jgi:small-conductance mechanosensitive channel